MTKHEQRVADAKARIAARKRQRYGASHPSWAKELINEMKLILGVPQ